MDLDDVSVGRQLATLSHTDVVLTGVLGKSPLETLQNLLTSSELKFTTADGLDDVRLGGILTTDREEHLPDVNTGGDADGLSVRVTHTRREPISSGTRKHFVGTDDMEGVNTDADVVSILSDGVGQVLVDGDTAGLESLRRDLLLLVAHQVSHEREEIDGRLLGTHVVNLDLRLGHTTAVPRLDVRLILLVAVASERTSAHG